MQSRVEYDDALPEPTGLPRPDGWFELFCCGSILAVLAVVLLVLGLVH